MMVEMVVQLILFLISAIWDGIDGGGFLGHQELLPKCIVLQIHVYVPITVHFLVLRTRPTLSPLNPSDIAK